MTKDNPIPQVIVVGILRVLLTTCPTASRSSGGIDLHREWTSTVKLLQEQKELFVDFKSGVFTHNHLLEKVLESQEEEANPGEREETEERVSANQNIESPPEEEKRDQNQEREEQKSTQNNQEIRTNETEETSSQS